MAGKQLSDHEISLRELKAKIGACTMEAVCGRSYVLVAELTQWLRSRIHSDKSTTQVGRLLMTAYPDQILPSSTEQLWEKDNCSLLVFCILLLIGKGHLIDDFRRHDILDKHLPIPHQQLRTKLQDFRIPDAIRLAADFDEKQWPFCPAKFDLHSGQEYNEHKILPICKKVKINEKGGTAQLWQIEVKEEFVGHRLKEAVAFSRYNCSLSETEPDWRYEFALKTFEDGSMDIFKNERRAFDALPEHNGMVRFLADYSHAERRHNDTQGQSKVLGNQDDPMTRNTFNLLLEFGEVDLDEFFAQRLPPVLQDETDQFWRALFEIADALDGIHNLRINIHGFIRELDGWHADIKPDNILSVQGRFKLADPGFAKFVEKGEKDPEEFVLGGTETYGAPERHPGRRGTISAVSQTIDIWSLACVFSIAATWVVFGYPGIQQFRKVREKAISGIISAPFHYQYPQRSTSISAGDYFHDGRQVLNVVTDWHKVLRNALRKTDTVTSRLLDLVDQKMLLGSASSRIKAKDLSIELENIVHRSEKGPRVEMPANILKTLLETDQDAASLVSLETDPKQPEQMSGPDKRKARKSRLMGQPLMKTAHRSEGLQSVLASYHAQPVRHPTADANARTICTSDTADGSQPSHPPSAQNNARASIGAVGYSHDAGHSFFPSEAQKKGTRTPKTHTPQDVFSAWEEVERRNKNNILRKERKDKLLTRYFGNRDLVCLLEPSALIIRTRPDSDFAKKFLVDNGESMKPHWAGTKYLLRTLVHKVAGQDENGLDLSFTMGPQKLENEKSNSSKWEKIMKEAEPMSEARTDMKTPLHEILKSYLEHVTHVRQRKHRQPSTTYRRLTLIILTDGIWAGMGNKQNAVNHIIVNMVKKIQVQIGDLVDRPISIEFVQFGNDQEATYRLRRLDTGMEWEGIPDIIDTEHATGDVNKMLLGSFVEEYDDEDEEDQMQDPKTPLKQTTSPDELSYTSSPPGSSSKSSTNRPTLPPEPSFFISRPTG
ncbi:MAG: hypothetical protein Q9209_002163 [Squamulea sp. 1 TL-2023]